MITDEEHVSIATRKSTMGKTQAILFAEAQSERWISWIRLFASGVIALVALYSFALENINLSAFIMQIGTAVTLAAYSLLFLSKSAKKWLQGYYVFGIVFLDVSVVTSVLWSYSIAGWSLNAVHSTLFSAYFLAIAFTALHHKVRLSIFVGVLSIIEYSVLYFTSLSGSMGVVYLNSMLLLLVVALLSGLISRRNILSIQKVVTSEVRYHNLVHRLPQMLFTLDSVGNYIWCNMASYSIIGVPSKAVKGRNIREFMVDGDSFRFNKSGVRETVKIISFSGEIKYVDFVMQPANSGDRIVSWEGSMTDVTDRERAIKEREEMSNRLFQYQKMESLGTLASGMAHDFNNILQTTYDIIDRAESETKEDSTRHFLMLISETLTDAKFLVSELLALGRKQPLNYSSVNISSFIREILPLFKEQLGEKYNIQLDAPQEDLWIQGEPNYLKRVFQNFFGNSKDAMPNGGTIKLELFSDKNERQASNVVIRFSDSGTGIPEELRGKIFDPFFTTKKPGKGTGLGLALVQRIVSLHSGRIEIEDSGNKGTTFRVEFPESEAGDSVNDTKSILLNRVSTSVLVLDDDPKIRSILSFFLLEFKYQVLEASNMNAGVKLLREHVKDCKVAIMDWKLGNDDPHAVIDNLRAINPELIIIIVSGYEPKEDSINDKKIFRWFTKPYEKDRLDLEIQKALYLLENKK